jgi:hypothetical protein
MTSLTVSSVRRKAVWVLFFFATNILSLALNLVASSIVRRIGLIKTMVFHPYPCIDHTGTNTATEQLNYRYGNADFPLDHEQQGPSTQASLLRWCSPVHRAHSSYGNC